MASIKTDALPSSPIEIPPRRFSFSKSPLLSEDDLHRLSTETALDNSDQVAPASRNSSCTSMYSSIDDSLASLNDSPSPTGIVPLETSEWKTPMLTEAMDLASNFHTLSGMDHIHRLTAHMNESNRKLTEAQKNLARETRMREGAVQMYKLHSKGGNIELRDKAYSEAKIAQKKVEECMGVVFRESTQVTNTSTTVLRHTAATLRQALLESSTTCRDWKDKCAMLEKELKELKEKGGGNAGARSLTIDANGLTLTLTLDVKKQ